MEASLGADRHPGWHSATARRLHHQLGHAVRRASKDSYWAGCWPAGKSLVKKLSDWCWTLDGQLRPPVSLTTDTAHSGVGKLDLACSVIPDDETESTISCADSGFSTAGWTSRCSRRRPRIRPSRRKKRRERQEDEEALVGHLYSSSMNEHMFESGKTPLAMLGPLAACMEEDGEEDEDWRAHGSWQEANSGSSSTCTSRCSSECAQDGTTSALDSAFDVQERGVCLSGSFEVCCDSVLGNISGCASPSRGRLNIADENGSKCEVRNETQAWEACNSGTNSRISQKGTKRSLSEVDFVPVDRDWYEAELQQVAISNLYKMMEFNPITFIAQVKIVLGDALSILSAQPPGCCDEASVWLTTVQVRVQQLFKLAGMTTLDDKCRSVLTLIASQITDRGSYARYLEQEGIKQWGERMKEELTRREQWDEEEAEMFFINLAEDMESHAVNISFCLETIDEIMSGDDVSYLWS